MNALRAAASICLVVTAIAIGYLCYAFYENEISLTVAKEAADCHELKLRSGDDSPCASSNPALQYGVSGGIAVVSLISSLALFGAAKTKMGPR